jgi:hypothetical protein
VDCGCRYKDTLSRKTSVSLSLDVSGSYSNPKRLLSPASLAVDNDLVEHAAQPRPRRGRNRGRRDQRAAFGDRAD